MSKQLTLKLKNNSLIIVNLKPRSALFTAARIKRFCLAAVFFAAWVGSAAAQSQPLDSPQKTPNREGSLSPEASQVTDKIGVAPLLARFKTGEANDAGSRTSLESLILRQAVTEKVMAASLDIDGVNAVIDTEIEQIKAIRSDLQSRRDKAQNIVNIASLITGGALGVVNTALQFNSKTANLGNGIGVGGGAASFILSIIGINKQNGGQRDLGDSPRMLARFFGREPTVTEAIKSEYPEEIWTYLNSIDPNRPTKVTRAEELIAKWQKEGRIEKDDSAKSSRQIDSVSGNLSQPRKLKIGDLENRIAMLQDIRAKISLMKRDLSEILRSLSAPQGIR